MTIKNNVEWRMRQQTMLLFGKPPPLTRLAKPAADEHGANHVNYINQNIEKSPNCNETPIARIDKSASRRDVVLFCPIASQCSSNI